MNFVLLSDSLWYLGHVLSGLSILFTQTHYYLAVSFVFVGQFITIVSRPIGRIQNTCSTQIDIEANSSKDSCLKKEGFEGEDCL